MARQQKPISWLQLGVVAAVMVIVFVLLLVREQERLDALRAQDAVLEKEYTIIKADKDDLAQLLERVGTDGHVENAARKTYGFIKEGEIIFAFQHPEMLEGYTQEEYQYIIEQLR